MEVGAEWMRIPLARKRQVRLVFFGPEPTRTVIGELITVLNTLKDSFPKVMVKRGH